MAHSSHCSSEETLERIRQDTIAKNGNDFWFRQEFLCDWGQASNTSYYGQILRKLEESRRIGIYPHNKDYPVYTCWDIGRTAIVFWQYYLVNNVPEVRVIDYYATDVIGNEPIVKFVLSKPYNYAWHFFPHDGSVTAQGTAVSRLEKFREFGLVNSSLLTREPVEEGIKRAVAGTANAVFHEPTTKELVAKLYLYRRKWNPLTGDYEGPENKSAAHGADAYRYVFVAIEQEFEKETCNMFMSQASQDDEYEMDEVVTSFYQPQSL